MKILFIFPNTHTQTGFHYGIAHISSVLKKDGHEVELWQLCEDLAPLPDENEYVSRIKKINPDIIGFSVVTNQWQYAEKYARWTRQATEAPIICGGIHTMACCDDILLSGYFDYSFRGECEIAFPEFVNRLSEGKDVSGTPNLGYMENGKININPVGTLPVLTMLPQKDYELFDFQKIIDTKNGWVGLMGSRGCPFACTYCFNHQMVSQYRKDLNCSFKNLNYIRHFNVKQIIDEIQYLLSKYKNIKMFIFDDDLFTFYKPYVVEFCEAYKKVTDIPFTVNAHVGAFDDERARVLSEANCKIVKFGVESGSPRIRKQVMQRHMKNESIIEAIRTAHTYNLHTSVFLMIGLPGETRDDVMETIRLMGTATPGRYRWTFFFPFPGTKAHEITAEIQGINYEKMTKLENFTDRSCLDFGKEHNLFLQKVGKIMPWFVNACSDLPVADFYRKQVEQILEMDENEWEKASITILEEDKQYSEDFSKRGLSHYAVKYNRFMGVISDFFLNEK